MSFSTRRPRKSIVDLDPVHIRERFSVIAPTVIEADCRAEALCEARFGAGREFPIFLYVTIKTKAQLPVTLRLHDLQHACASTLFASGQDVPTVTAPGSIRLRISGACSTPDRGSGSVEFDFDQHELGGGLSEALFDRPPALVELDAIDLGVAREGSEKSPHSFA